MKKLSFEKLEARNLLSVTPFSEDFSNGLPNWSYESTNEGRIQVVEGRLRLDDSRGNSTYSKNTVVIDLDLVEHNNIFLEGDFWKLKDETHDEEGVFTNLGRLDINPGHFKVVLPVGTEFIKIVQYDNYQAPYDGYEFDNILVHQIDTSKPADWPDGEAFHKNLFIDGGVGISSKGTYAADFLGWEYDTLFANTSAYQNSIMVSSSTDSNGALLYPDNQPRYEVYYMNGGSSTSHMSSLGSTGRDRVKTFFANGGSYTGSCAGAFAATSPRGYGIMPNKSIVGVAAWGTSTTVKFEDSEFADIMTELGFGTTVYNIPVYGGPIFRAKGVDIPGLQHFGTGSRYNAQQVAEYQVEGTGRIDILMGHPEYAKSGSNLGLMATVYERARRGAKQIPDTKGILTINQPWRMSSATQRIGDGQYHLYEVEIPTNSEDISISLTGKAKLYVQHDLPAHSQSYIASGKDIILENPEEETLYISVYGNHNVLNGESYVLTVSDGGEIIEQPEFKPVVENFANGLPELNWTYYSTGAGVIDASTGRLEMYSSVSRTYSLNEAILTVDLDQYKGLNLSFTQIYDMKDEYHRLPTTFVGHYNGDGVSLSSDGVNWTKLAHKNGVREIPLDDYSGELQIKFQQYDNWTRGIDGRAWDNIKVV